MEGTSICVLAMNRANTLRETIGAILTYAVEPYEIIIVDNGSTDHDFAPIIYPIADRENISIIRNESNLGLSVGTNQGLEAGKYDTLIHLDDDCLVKHHGWNQIMREYLMRPEIGMVVPGSYNEAIIHDDYHELRWGLGMCWGITKELFDDIGGYDPQLMHQNECDMALRVRMTGLQLAGILKFNAIHNDPGGPRSEISLAREHLGVVQFRSKWCSYFRGRDWDYGTDPIYLMQHWPPDQEFLRRWALQNGVNLNPAPDYTPTSHEDQQAWIELDHLSAEQKIFINGGGYLIYRELRNDYCHWEHTINPGAYKRDENIAIARWERLTGERYEGYRWPHNLLRVD